MNTDQLKDMQEVVEDAKANALRFPEISLDDLEALVKLGFECLKLREQQRWIPVSERLPDDGQEVLFESVKYAKETLLGEFIAQTKNFFSGEKEGYYDNIYSVTDGQVTRWMPLPEAPAGEQA